MKSMVDQIEVKILIQILSLMFTEIKIMKQSNIENSFIQLFSGIEDQHQIKNVYSIDKYGYYPK